MQFTALWWTTAISAVMWTVTSVFILRGAYLGSAGHRRPRLLLGIAVSIWAVLFWIDLFDLVPQHVVAAMIRATSWVVAFSLSATAWTGVRFGRRVQSVATEIEGMRDRVGDE